MFQLSDYIDKVPSYNRQKPNCNAWLTALLTPVTALLALAQSLPTLFDVNTAVGQQLDYVGAWVGVTRYIVTPITGVFFTFDTAGLGYDQGVWLGPNEGTTGITVLDDGHFRLLILARIAANNWNGQAGTAQAAWNAAFAGSGISCVVIDGDNGTATVRFSTGTSVLQQALVTGGYIPLKPVGIVMFYVFAP
jgi:hypothetical protein